MRTLGKHRYAAVLWFLLGAAGAEAQPVNDDCADATLITSLPFADTVDTTTATTEIGDPPLACDTFFSSVEAKSVWYRFVAAAPTLLEVSTLGSDYDTLLVARWSATFESDGVALNTNLDYSAKASLGTP